MARTSKRQLVADVAQELFFENGFNATGINQITQEAEVASMTLYNNFPSKDDLVLHILRENKSKTLLSLYAAAAEKGSGKEKLAVIFSWLKAAAPTGVSAAHLHAASEYRDSSHPVNELVRGYHGGLLALLQTFYKDSEADQVAVVIHGAIASFVITQDVVVFTHAQAAAVKILSSKKNDPA